MIETLLGKLDTYRATRLYGRSRYRKALADIPPTLLPYWKTTAHHEFEGIPRDAFFFARAAEGLMMFFDCVRHSEKPCGLPSVAADSVWHAWLRLDPQGLERFCLRHFGRHIAHIEAAHMPSMGVALANCLVTARLLELMPILHPHVPRLFALDYQLGMPRGAGYVRRRAEVGYAALDDAGRLSCRPVTPPAMSAAGLLAAGLISDAAYQEWLLRMQASDGGSVSISSDGGCDGGSGDGGSCGGGCGGGGCGS